MVDATCIQVAADLVSHALPEYSSSIKDEFFSAVQIYLLIMEGIILNDENASLSVLGADLVKKSDRVANKLHNAWTSTITDSELKVCFTTYFYKIILLEISCQLFC